jgi:hypothetical protein
MKYKFAYLHASVNVAGMQFPGGHCGRTDPSGNVKSLAVWKRIT